jgi:hypothetical protein
MHEPVWDRVPVFNQFNPSSTNALNLASSRPSISSTFVAEVWPLMIVIVAVPIPIFLASTDGGAAPAAMATWTTIYDSIDRKSVIA